MNYAVFRYVAAFGSSLLNTIMLYWSESFVVVFIALLAYMYVKKDRGNMFPFVVALLASYILSEVIKYIVREPRPCTESSLAWINQTVCESGFSFPSSHASALVGLTFFLKNYKYVRAAYIVWVLVTLFGRVYLGQHYFTDVVSGAALSIAVCYVMYRYRAAINSAGKQFVSLFAARKATG